MLNEKKNLFLSLLSLFTIFFIFTSVLSVLWQKPQISISEPVLSCQTGDLSGILDPYSKIAIFDGKKVDLPQIAFQNNNDLVLGSNSDNKWIEVDLSEQKLIAREGESIFLETAVSSGLPQTPTPTGEFRIWIKLRAARMQGGTGKYYYNLPNVPYIMYFSNSSVLDSKGYGLHGAYWHNDFGTRRSHGCVNLPISVAERLYYWATPNIPDGKGAVKSTGENPGTRVVIHD